MTDGENRTERALPYEKGIPSLEISISPSSEKVHFPLTKDMMSIGRSQQNDISIPAKVVSSFHFQILRQDDSYILVHPHKGYLRTTNGLHYHGRHIHGDETYQKVLQRGDMFRIGSPSSVQVTIIYNDGSGSPSPSTLLPTIYPIPLRAPMITLGRADDNTVVLKHPQVSAHHARLERIQHGYGIVDQGSTNHTYVNGQIISKHLLTVGDEIRIGPFKLIYDGQQLRQYDESNGIDVEALQVRQIGNNGTVLLADISLPLQPRKFVAIVGGSGAGKSTLLNALSGVHPASSGSVLYNGQDFYRSMPAFRTQLGYVPQQDIVHQDLTVERALYYAARIRLPSDYSHQQVQQRIDEVLGDVDMKHRRTLMISKLSGGQRKRVSIALELLAKPNIFFLDEPTSGLDPGLDYKMMFLLRQLADQGRTIALVTHATSNISHFCDSVCFLAYGGRLVYYGPPDEAKKFFNTSEFAEIYTTLEPSEENKISLEEVEQKFKRSHDYQQYVMQPLQQSQQKYRQTIGKPPLQAQHVSRQWHTAWRQFGLLSLRYLELLKNNTKNMMWLLAQAPIIALILVCFIKFGIHDVTGAGGFDPKTIIQCPTGTPMLLNGQPHLVPVKQAADTSCQHVKTFLLQSTAGKAYVKARGGVDTALQDFILPGAGEAPKILFIMVFTAIMFSCINGTREIVKEVPIYLRERMVNLGILPYMFSKVVVMGIFCLLQSAVIVLMVHLADPLLQSIFLFPPLEVYITVTLASLSGLMMGLAISAFAANSEQAMTLIPLVLVPQVIFSGVLFPLTDNSMQMIGFVFPIRWAMAGLGSTVGLHSDKLAKDALLGSNYIYHSTLFSTYNKGDATSYLLLTWLALVFLIVTLGALTAWLLKRKDARA